MRTAKFLVLTLVASLLYGCGGEQAEMPEPGLMITSNDEAESGDTVCVDLVASDFQNITALQYSLEWDDRILTFIRTDNYELPGLSEQHFNPSAGEITDQLTLSWNHDQPTTLSDSSAIHSVCFLAEGRINARSSLVLTNDPKRLMAVSEGDTLDLSTQPGRIMIAAAEE